LHRDKQQQSLQSQRKKLQRNKFQRLKKKISILMVLMIMMKEDLKMKRKRRVSLPKLRIHLLSRKNLRSVQLRRETPLSNQQNQSLLRQMRFLSAKRKPSIKNLQLLTISLTEKLRKSLHQEFF